MLAFETRAKARAKKILEKFDYAVIEILGNENEYGDCETVGVEKCTDIERIKFLYDTSYDIQIKTPDGDNF